MKKILSILIAAVISITAFSQSYLNIGSPFGNNMQRLNVIKGLYIPKYNDTTDAYIANLDSLGQIIQIKNVFPNKIYIRDSVVTGGHKWSEIGSGSGGSQGLQDVITVNPSLTENNFIPITDGKSLAFSIKSTTEKDSVYTHHDNSSWFAEYDDSLGNYSVMQVDQGADVFMRASGVSGIFSQLKLDISSGATFTEGATKTGIKYISNDTTNWTDFTLITKGYLNDRFSGSPTILDTTIQWGVDSTTNTPPIGVPTGSYIRVGTAGTGAFSGHNNEIAQWNGASWDFFTASSGDLLFDVKVDQTYKFNGSTWVAVGRPTIHAGLDSYPFPILIGSSTAQVVRLQYNTANRISLGGANGVTFNQLTGASAGLMGLSTTGVASNVQIGTGLTLLAGVLSSTGGVTPAALTKTDDTNVTLTLGGTPATALLQATSLTLGWTGTLALSRGGTNANLTASNGGIFYSTATAGAILAGTATANKILYSGATAAPSWSVPTFPVSASATSRKIIVSDGTNWVASTETYAVPGSSGNVLTSDGTNWTSAAPAAAVQGVVRSSASTLTLTTSNNFYAYTGSTSTTWTLPALSGNTGYHLTIKNESTTNLAAITLTRAGSDNIFWTSSGTTFVIYPGETYEVDNDGTFWVLSLAPGYWGKTGGTVFTQGASDSLSIGTSFHVAKFYNPGTSRLDGNIGFAGANPSATGYLFGQATTTTNTFGIWFNGAFNSNQENYGVRGSAGTNGNGGTSTVTIGVYGYTSSTATSSFGGKMIGVRGVSEIDLGAATTISQGVAVSGQVILGNTNNATGTFNNVNVFLAESISNISAAADKFTYYHAFTSDTVLTSLVTNNIWGIRLAYNNFNNQLAGNTMIGSGFTSVDSVANSTLHVAGSFSTPVNQVSSTYAITALDEMVECTSGTFTVTLPTAVGIKGREYDISNTGAGTITIATTSSQTFANVVTTPTTLTLSTVGNYTVKSNGTGWLVK